MTNSSLPAAASDDIIHESRITFRQGVVLLFLYLAYILEGYDLVVMAYAAPVLSSDWGIQPEELGLLFSASVLGMSLGGMFLASLADLYGRKLVVGSMLLVVGAATIGVAYSSSVSQLVVLRLFTGLGLGASLAAMTPLVAEFSPRRYRMPIVALMISGAAVGAIVGGLVTSPAIDAYGWQSVFTAAGSLTIVTSVLIFVLVPESIAFIIKRKPPGALEKVNRTLSYMGHQCIEALPPVSEAVAKESASVKSLLMRSRRKMTFTLWAAFSFVAVANHFVHSWLPQVLVQAGVDHERAIQSLTLSFAGGMVGAPLIGWLGRRWALNRIIAASLVVGGATLVVLSGLIEGLDGTTLNWFFWTVIFISGFCTTGGTSNLHPVTMTIYPAQIRSTGLGWASGLGRIGGVLSLSLAGVLLSQGVSSITLLRVSAAFYLIAATCAFFLEMLELDPPPN